MAGPYTDLRVTARVSDSLIPDRLCSLLANAFLPARPTGADTDVVIDHLPTRGVLLVGSVPLGSADEVFQMAATELGDRLVRVPDGETGPRSDWIVWQYPVLSSRPEFVVGPPGDDPHRAANQARFA